ncbi:MAG: anhydro-N-acetylmuramic acid kinase [Candidatus Marinimicrobia bacterium]|nr:anhydro-N-acetylmuramic acid kinase [Candidatus Neomarinimicrobiota bacterium]MCF7851544.1 anhydro-N-acetylmuramic acid kinase [Candidatus Neomarinimicrobiota bacterium]MCF7905301.1 anhydro-N-acetylmuramic acid kinase [Candidatus Neomarinimicrobiota bacterium]
MEKSKGNKLRILGLMTGTSADGLDLCLVEFTDNGEKPGSSVLFSGEVDYPAKFKAAFRDPLELSDEEVAALDKELGAWFAESIAELNLSFDLIGSHGQTIRHEPPHFTQQIGDPTFMANKFKVPVIYDFRSKDVELGGQGAPLIPILDQYLYASLKHDILCLNIGGISNITLLPAGEKLLPIIAWDTGPGNTLIDKAVRSLTGGAHEFDPSGTIAQGGNLNESMLKHLLSHEFYKLSPPKSAGQEQFGLNYFKSIMSRYNSESNLNHEDIVLTLTVLTARTITDSIKQLGEAYTPSTMYVSGGGTKNKTLMSLIQEALPEINCETVAKDGVTEDNKEAFGFAYLAYLRMNDLPGNIPTVTGASRPARLGKICYPD